MLFLTITALVLGLAFLLFGYFIYFRKKYHLINGFQAAWEAGRKDESYARRVGLIELWIGIVLLVTGVVMILFH